MPLDDVDLAFAQQYVEKLIPSVEKSLRTQTKPGPHTYSPFGSMAAEERDEALIDAMEKTILPGFERAGLQVQHLWSSAKANRAAARKAVA